MRPRRPIGRRCARWSKRKRGCDPLERAVNAPQADGMTALHWAAYHDDAESCDCSAAHANVNAANRYGVTPLSLACTNGNAAIVDCCSRPAPTRTRRSGRRDAADDRRAHGHGRRRQGAARARAPVDAKDERRGQTALMWAAAEGHAAVVAGARRCRRRFQVRTPSGFTPLLFAVREGRIDVVRVLLEAGADVNDVIPADGPRRREYGGGCLRRARRRCSSRSRTRTSSWRPCCSTPAPNPNADATGYTVLHRITVVRKPGVGDNDPAAGGSGNMTSLEFVKKLVAQRRQRQRAHDEEAEPEQHAR